VLGLLTLKPPMGGSHHRHPSLQQQEQQEQQEQQASLKSRKKEKNDLSCWSMPRHSRRVTLTMICSPA